jgi:hypothetical protein
MPAVTLDRRLGHLRALPHSGRPPMTQIQIASFTIAIPLPLQNAQPGSVDECRDAAVRRLSAGGIDFLKSTQLFPPDRALVILLVVHAQSRGRASVTALMRRRSSLPDLCGSVELRERCRTHFSRTGAASERASILWKSRDATIRRFSSKIVATDSFSTKKHLMKEVLSDLYRVGCGGRI